MVEIKIILSDDGRITITGPIKNKVLTAFLTQLGISKGVIEKDVEGMEHHLSDETVKSLEKRLLRKFTFNPLRVTVGVPLAQLSTLIMASWAGHESSSWNMPIGEKSIVPVRSKSS